MCSVSGKALRKRVDTKLEFAELADRALRRRRAKEQCVPPYVIFSDKSLKSVAMLHPANRAAFLQVHGVGDRQAHIYAEGFPHHIARLETSRCPE
mgnify:FL=1